MVATASGATLMANPERNTTVARLSEIGIDDPDIVKFGTKNATSEL
jgi:hypothetical protein